MASIVGVHGIAQELKGPNVLKEKWLPALKDGLTLAGSADLLSGLDFTIAFYGDLFREQGDKSLDLPPYTPEDVDSEFQKALLETWWSEAARIDDEVPGPDESGKFIRTPLWVQDALNALAGSRVFGRLAEAVIILFLKQVDAYVNDPNAKKIIQRRIADSIVHDTRVLIGHSLGSVAAYEALCANPGWPVRTFVSLGSPLGIRGLIFNRLSAEPIDGKGHWPGTVKHWINIADAGDPVALVKNLGPLFGEQVENHLIHNGADAHHIEPYLTARETGRAIATGLVD
jgi:hypothetical protein